MTENLTGFEGQPGTQMAEDRFFFLRELSVPGEGLELMTRSQCLEIKISLEVPVVALSPT